MGGWSLTPRPDCFTTGNDPVPNVKEIGWDPGLTSTSTENLAPTGIRSPALIESLYQLRYPNQLQ